MSISKKNQIILFIVVAICWFIAGGFMIGTYLPIGISFIVLGLVFVALTANGYRQMKNQ
ncbi:MAG: hypothetical protein JSV62_16135 [Promethearchaeota archaeon]|nr:MAG: hypothetical protein JSV62_16135 [Candidatus Lokiarchaeota archaeon]